MRMGRWGLNNDDLQLFVRLEREHRVTQIEQAVLGVAFLPGGQGILFEPGLCAECFCNETYRKLFAAAREAVIAGEGVKEGVAARTDISVSQIEGMFAGYSEQAAGTVRHFVTVLREELVRRNMISESLRLLRLVTQGNCGASVLIEACGNVQRRVIENKCDRLNDI